MVSEDLIELDVFEEALRGHLKMPLDADNHPPGTLDARFIDYGPQVRDLNTADWQIVFGGHGTGKTHLLRVYEERSRRGATSRRPTDVVESLPIYIDARSFASRQYLNNDEKRAQASFRRFIDVLDESLSSAVDELQSPANIYSRLSGRRRKAKAKRALDILQQIRDELDHAKLVYPFDQEHLEESDDIEDIDREATGRDASVDLDLKGPRASVSASSGAGRDRKQVRRSSSSRHGVGEPRWHHVRALVAELCKAISVQRVDILIDNWNELDTFGNSAVQPHFAELLKKSLRGDHGGHTISVKIAADGLSTRLWDVEEGLGLRSTEIETIVNLNEALLSDEELVMFFERLLFQRLLTWDRRLAHLFDPDSGALHPSFIRTIFGDRETFELLVRGAEGKIRRFLHDIKRLTRSTDASLTSPWSREAVVNVVADREQDDGQYQYQSPAVQLLLDRIKPEVIARDQAVFSIGDDEHREFGGALKELLFKTLLSPHVPEHYQRQATRDLLAFAVSRDLMKEWHRAKAKERQLQELFDGGPPTLSAEPSLTELRIFLRRQNT